MRSLYYAAVASALVALLAFSLWAEWGPWAWVAAAQLAVIKAYGVSLTGIIVALAFILPMIPLWYRMDGSRPTLALAVGLPVAAIAVHLGMTVFFCATGGAAAGSSSFAEAVAGAGFLPKNFRMDAASLPPVLNERTVGVHGSIEGNSSYTPFDALAADGTPVVLRMEELDTYSPNFHPLSGFIYKAPLPYLVRRDWPAPRPLFAVVVVYGKSVREFWAFQALFYALALGYGAWRWYKAAKARALPPVDTGASKG